MSNTFKTSSTIETYELNGSDREIVGKDLPDIIVKNHGIRRDFVIIEIGDTQYTILADELSRAIDNAQHAHKY